MTICGYKKSIENLSTEFNMRYTNTKYFSLFPTVPVAEWLAYFPFDSSTRVRAELGVILLLKK